MGAGLFVTGIVALGVASSPSLVMGLASNPMLMFGLFGAQIMMVLAFGKTVAHASRKNAVAMFLAYAALMGVSLSTLFLVYTQASLARVFFITGGAFLGLSLYGSSTKRDLSPVGHFMGIGLMGLILASIVNIFLASPAIHWISSMAGVVIFAGLTAYDSQKLKQMFLEHGDQGNLAIRGALTLYLDFINMFLFLLRFFGQERD